MTTDITGTLALPSLAPDPLCPGSTPPTSVEVDGSSALVQRPGPAAPSPSSSAVSPRSSSGAAPRAA